jgi:hypothetical protein
MPTLNLSQEFHVFDNPEALSLKNPGDASPTTTSYGFRRAMTLAKIENITRFLVWKANITPFKPMVDCEITDAALVKYYVNSIDNSGNREYYGLDCTQQS